MFRVGGLNLCISNFFPAAVEINKDGDQVFTEDDIVWTKEVITLLLFLDQI